MKNVGSIRKRTNKKVMRIGKCSKEMNLVNVAVSIRCISMGSPFDRQDDDLGRRATSRPNPPSDSGGRRRFKE